MTPKLVGLAILGCALTNVNVFADECDDAVALIEKAQSAYEIVDAKGFAWVPTETYLADAKTENSAGACAEAIVRAQRALDTANAAMRQAEVEAAAWQSRVPE